MLLTKVLIYILTYYLVGYLVNLFTAYVVIHNLTKKCENYPGLMTELYRNNFTKYSPRKIYKKESFIKKFFITQTLWPLNVLQMIDKGKRANAEFKKYILDHTEITWNTPRDENSL